MQEKLFERYTDLLDAQIAQSAVAELLTEVQYVKVSTSTCVLPLRNFESTTAQLFVTYIYCTCRFLQTMWSCAYKWLNQNSLLYSLLPQMVASRLSCLLHCKLWQRCVNVLPTHIRTQAQAHTMWRSLINCKQVLLSYMCRCGPQVDIQDSPDKIPIPHRIPDTMWQNPDNKWMYKVSPIQK